MNSFSLGVTEPDWFLTIAAFLCGFFYFKEAEITSMVSSFASFIVWPVGQPIYNL